MRERSLILPLVLHMSRNLDAVHSNRGHLRLDAQELSEGLVAGTVGSGGAGTEPANRVRLRLSRRVNFSDLDSTVNFSDLELLRP